MYTKSDDITVMLHASVSHHQGCANLPLCQPAPLSPTIIECMSELCATPHQHLKPDSMVNVLHVWEAKQYYIVEKNKTESQLIKDTNKSSDSDSSATMLLSLEMGGKREIKIAFRKSQGHMTMLQTQDLVDLVHSIKPRIYFNPHIFFLLPFLFFFVFSYFLLFFPGLSEWYVIGQLL